jgi:hypothetical protein
MSDISLATLGYAIEIAFSEGRTGGDDLTPAVVLKIVETARLLAAGDRQTPAKVGLDAAQAVDRARRELRDVVGGSKLEDALAVLRYLRGNGPSGKEQIVHDLRGRDARTIGSVVQRLWTSDYLERFESGYYAISDMARERGLDGSIKP